MNKLSNVGISHDSGAADPSSTQAADNSSHLNAPDSAVAPSTVETYTNNVARMYAAARKEFDIRWREPDPREVVVWLIDNMAQYRRTTVRMYRSSLIYWFRQLGTPEAHEAIDRLENQIQGGDDGDGSGGGLAMPAAGTDVDALNTSALKRKQISQDELDRLCAALVASKSRWRAPTVAWLISGAITGLRPIEWISTRLVENEGEIPFLLVKNAKATQNRAHGEFRKLHLIDVTDKEFIALKGHINLVQAWATNGKYKDYMTGCSKLLYRVSTKLWPRRIKHIALYTMRHKFASDAKSCHSKEEVAALMGHGSTETAGTAYGLARYGTGSLKVSPDSEDVARVAERNPQPGPGPAQEHK